MGFMSVECVERVLVRLTGVHLFDFCCSSVSQLVCCWVLVLFHLSDESWFMFAVLIHGWVDVLHADRTTSMCIWTTAGTRVRLLQRKPGFSPPLPFPPFPPPQWFITDRSKAIILLWFILFVKVRPFSVRLWLTVQFVAICWEELSPWLFICAVFIKSRLNCGCPFPVCCLGQDMELDCIDSWSLPFYLLFIDNSAITCTCWM